MSNYPEGQDIEQDQSNEKVKLMDHAAVVGTMSQIGIEILVPALIILGVIGYSYRQEFQWSDTHESTPVVINETHMKLFSPNFEHNGNIPSKYTCDGLNINPELEIREVPDATKSFALIMEDPDVPKTIRQDGMWDHWLIWNIASTTQKIGEGEKISADYGLTTKGTKDYGGPCPPDKAHRYFFKLFALDTTLALPSGSTKHELEQAMQGHILETAELIGIYERVK